MVGKITPPGLVTVMQTPSGRIAWQSNRAAVRGLFKCAHFTIMARSHFSVVNTSGKDRQKSVPAPVSLL
jgi:hypothetical protein